MASPQDELRELRAQLAGLTARIYRLEQRAGLEVQSQPEREVTPSYVEKATPPAPPPPATTQEQRQPVWAPGQAPEAERLESKIGKLWLNRIGIFAIHQVCLR